MFLCSAFLLGASKEIIWMGFSRLLVAANERLFGCQVEKGYLKNPGKEKSTQLPVVCRGWHLFDPKPFTACGRRGFAFHSPLLRRVFTTESSKPKGGLVLFEAKKLKKCWVEKERGCCTSTPTGGSWQMNVDG